MRIKNCVNCGAPLRGQKCDYCGTEYGENGDVRVSFDDSTGIVKVGGQEYKCYVSQMEIHPLVSANAGRDMSGRMLRDTVRLIHKFTLVEV